MNRSFRYIAIGLGVPEAHVRVITPLPRQHEKNVEVIKG